MNLAPMFPSCARKSPQTLYEQSKRASMRHVARFLKRFPVNHCQTWSYEKHVSRFRRYFRQRLPAHILTDILETLIPQDKWTFPCTDTKERLNCKLHVECEQVYNRLDQILQLLFSEDIGSLVVNLKKVKVQDYHSVVERLRLTLTKLPTRPYPNLKNLILKGGTVHSDNLISDVEHLVEILKEAAKNLVTLHLPVVSNVALRSISDMDRLRRLVSDRTKGFNKRGLYHLCHPDSKTNANLEVLHLGVFKHKHFEKSDVAGFFKCMKNLRDFSLFDKDRALVRLEGQQPPGDKVLTYSVFKLAIKETEEQGGGRIGPHVFTTGLTEMRVVDKLLKPHYILESAPLVDKLHIDWQEELCLQPFHRYPATWFTEMLKKQTWAVLAERLTSLHITFPAAHSPNSYGLPLDDYTRLMQHLSNLTVLELVGAGMEGPLPLIPTLKYCPQLRELLLEKTPIHVPDNYDVVDPTYVSASLKKFYFLGEMSSLLVHDFLTRGISCYMPELVELEVQPQTVMGYGGLRPSQVRELNQLKKLRRLSLPLSIRECIMNMPEVIYVLREFPSLRFLILSWGMWCESYDISKGKISYLMAWLYNALGAENANIHLQLCYKQHPNLFNNPVPPKFG